jgi:hypothetical protein
MKTLIRLPALIGSHPLSALSSFGLLRLISQWDFQAKLSFTLEDDWIASVETSEFDSSSALIEALAKWAKSQALDQMLSWADDVRVAPSDYQRVLGSAIDDGNLVLANFLSAIVADGSVDAQKGLVKPSALYMVSGQQSFLGGMREILLQVRASAQQLFEEALTGPWRYATRTHSLGWDPNTERLYALRHRAPTSEKPSCIAGAVLLAFWALPIFPALSNARKPVTIGFSRNDGDHYFSWPVFSTLIDLAELASLLHVGATGWTSDDGRRPRSGIEATYESSRAEFGQGYAVFRAARLAQLKAKNTRQQRSKAGRAERV